MEENTDSSNSTLTHCANTALKKKRNFESDGDNARSYFHFRMPLPWKMDERDELFRQLVYARLSQPPYDKYEGWNDDQFWGKIVHDVYKHDRFSQPSVRLVIKTVSEYCEKYNKDSQLKDMVDSSLKKNICPGIKGRELLITKVRSMEWEKRVPFMPGLGYKGGLALQFKEDMDDLQINDDDLLLFFSKYGPTSTMYISIALQDPALRRNMLRSLYNDLKKNHIQPSAHSSASSRKKWKS